MNKSQLASQPISNENVGFFDKQIRVAIGAAMIIAVLMNSPETMGAWKLLLLASIPVIASAILGWDPLYALMGKSTYVPKEEEIQQRDWTYSNVGIIDRGIRFAIGILLLADALTMANMPINAIMALMSIPFIVTAIIAWDPIYALFKLNSFAMKADAEIAEPGASDQSLARYYEFPNLPEQNLKAPYAKAA